MVNVSNGVLLGLFEGQSVDAGVGESVSTVVVKVGFVVGVDANKVGLLVGNCVFLVELFVGLFVSKYDLLLVVK